MAIDRKEIINRKFNGFTRETEAFEYVLKGLQGPHGEPYELRIWFSKMSPEMYGIPNNKPTYEVFTVIGDVVYRIPFQMQKANEPLELIAATGLVTLKSEFQAMANQYETLSYTISDVIKDM